MTKPPTIAAPGSLTSRACKCLSGKVERLAAGGRGQRFLAGRWVNGVLSIQCCGRLEFV